MPLLTWIIAGFVFFFQFKLKNKIPKKRQLTMLLAALLPVITAVFGDMYDVIESEKIAPSECGTFRIVDCDHFS